MIKTITNKYDDKIIEYEFDSGLKLTWIINEMISKYIIELIVNFGAKHSLLNVDNKQIKIIPGTAHFLEHMMFTSNGKDLFQTFYNQNIDINALTNLHTTNYFFQTTKLDDHILENLFSLVDYRKLDAKTLRKEKHIITQEIISYETDVDEKFGSNFKKHYFKDSIYEHDILGTKDSILKIDLSYLDLVFKNTYILNNMHLVIQSNEINEEIVTYLSNLKNNNTNNSYLIADIPKSIENNQIINEVSNKLDTIRLIHIIKIDDKLTYKEHLIFKLFSYLIYNLDSYLYKKTNQNKQNNYYFHVNYDFTPEFSYLFFNGETNNFKKLYKILLKSINKFKFSEIKFNKAKQLFYYKFLQSLLNPLYIQEVSVMLLNYNLTYLDLISIYENITYSDFVLLIDKYLNLNNFLYLSN